MLTLKQLSMLTFGTLLTLSQIGEVAQAIVAFNKTELKNHRVDFASRQYTGVVSLNALSIPSLNPGCSGALLSSGLHILTAAHCVDSTLINFNPVATFNLPSGRVDVPLVDAFVHPKWNGDNDRDIAVLKLGNLAPIEAGRYDIYRDKDEVGQIFTTVGYGNRGVGVKGEIEGSAKSTIAYFGQNRYERAGVKFIDPFTGEQVKYSRNELLYDFDNGKAQNDLFGQYLGLHDLGLGNLESNTASGDSGAPSFIGNLIAGIVAFGDAFGSPPDVDGTINSSFGEFSGDTRVSSYQKFVDKAVAGRIPSSINLNFPQTDNLNTNIRSGNSSPLIARSVAVTEPTSGLGSFIGIIVGVGVSLKKRQA